MGEPRADLMYWGRSLLDRGITLAGSSDRPVATGAPLRAIQFMVERASNSGQTIGADEAITVDEVLAAYTLGSVTTGKLADLVVLGDDPRTIDPRASQTSTSWPPSLLARSSTEETLRDPCHASVSAPIRRGCGIPSSKAMTIIVAQTQA